MQIGFIGLGKMGSRMAAKLVLNEHDVIVWNRSKEAISNFKFQISNSDYKKEIETRDTIEQLVASLDTPRIVWSMVSAGEATQSVLDEVEKYIEKDDIVIDGGNAHFSDTEKRYQECKNRGIRYLGIGVSGGLIAAENGYPLMVGGDKSAYNHIQPILASLAKPNGGFQFFGQGGAGHFVKMVHNGVEYGYMQALGEGFGVLEKSQYSFNLLDVAKLYTKGTLLSGFMMDRTVDALKNDPTLAGIQGIINASGEAKWTIEEADKEAVQVPVIKESLRFRELSQVDESIQTSFAARMVAALRNAFGGHEVKKK